MKFAPVTEKPKFTPITITLESEEEVAKMYAIFNYSTIVRSLNFGDIRCNLRDANTKAGNNDINPDKYHRQLFEGLEKC